MKLSPKAWEVTVTIINDEFVERGQPLTVYLLKQLLLEVAKEFDETVDIASR